MADLLPIALCIFGAAFLAVNISFWVWAVYDTYAFIRDHRNKPGSQYYL